MSICKKVQNATHFKSPAPVKMKCWPGCSPKKGTAKTKNSPTGKKNTDGSPKRVNNCDCG